MTTLPRVQVPHVDGRVGMAALLAEEDAPAPCMATLYEQSAAQLPVYAQPRFVRVLRDASEVRHNAAPATSPAAIRPPLPDPKFRYSRPSPSSRAQPRCGTRASTQTKCRASSCATRRRAPTCRSTRGRTRRSSRARMCWADWARNCTQGSSETSITTIRTVMSPLAASVSGFYLHAN